MKDDDVSKTIPSTIAATKRESTYASILGRTRYKFWVLAAILLLAFWSMLTGSVTLKWSAGSLNRISDNIDFPIHDDLDVLEVEEREKVVRHMWDVYTHSSIIRLPRFWQEAFEAAYENLVSDVPGVRDGAVSEIAKMSLRLLDLEPPPVQLTNTKKKQRSPKKKEESKEVTIVGTSQ